MRANLGHAAFNRHEISGSLGDMGTFLPLLLGMVITNGLDFTSALFFAGVMNIATGLVFGVPMAVQPMKAIAAVALAERLTVHQILAAGIGTSVVILLFGATGFIDWLYRMIPRPVVRGLQLGLGLKLMQQGIELVTATHTWLGWDSYALALVGLGLIYFWAESSRVPTALVIFIGGLAIGYWTHFHGIPTLQWGFHLPHWVAISKNDFLMGFWRGAIPQIPLTTLNSVIAVCALSQQLFPDEAVSNRKVSISVGLMNLVSCWFGAMPMCHGAGGLAGQYRFGARSNGSILFLGGAKVVVAVVFGAALLPLLMVFPRSLLGVLLAISGLELASVARDQGERTGALIMLGTAGLTLFLKNLAVGFLLGWAFGLLVTFMTKSTRQSLERRGAD